MTLQEKITAEMQKAVAPRRGVLKILVAEFQRSPNKLVTDEEAVKVVKKCIKNEKLMLGYARTKQIEQTCLESISTLEEFLPKSDEEQVTKAQVNEWIVANINFENYPNKMAAMKTIMQQFKGKIDGAIVKKLLQET